ncbi:MAG: DHHW family protein [Defluviitaleaceae bacterium]|nr:DHHW family protein [Defluviitaleaceae bacterium]
MKKRWAMIISLAFFIPLFALGILWWLTPAADYSETENRALAQRPRFSLRELFSGRWTSDFDEYFADQFPHRDGLMEIAGNTGRAVYIEREGGTAVIHGDENLDIIGTITENDGNFFLIVGDRIMHIQETHHENNANYTRVMNRFAQAVSPNLLHGFAVPDRRVISMIVPNSFVLYAPSQYITEAHDTRGAINAIYNALDDRIITVDAFSFLYDNKDEYLFFRTDHHWTARGAWQAYVAFCEAMGLTPCDITLWEHGYIEGFVGLRHRQVQGHPQAAVAARNPDTVEFFLPPTPYTATVFSDITKADGRGITVVNPHLPPDIMNKYNVFTEGDHALIHIHTDTRNGKSIAVVKESFANAFVPFLLAHYENIYVIDFRRFNRADQPTLDLAAFMRDHDINDVLVINNFSVPNSRDLTDALEGFIRN